MGVQLLGSGDEEKGMASVPVGMGGKPLYAPVEYPILPYRRGRGVYFHAKNFSCPLLRFLERVFS